jgi:hypothetical protein
MRFMGRQPQQHLVQTGQRRVPRGSGALENG